MNGGQAENERRKAQNARELLPVSPRLPRPSEEGLAMTTITVVTGASGHIGANLIRALLARAVILALSRDKVGNSSVSDTNGRISSTIVN
jgi:hypothetical protein